MIDIILMLLMAMGGDSTGTKFQMNVEPQNIFSPTKELGINWNVQLCDVVPLFIRQRSLKAPGDYFRHPSGAKTEPLDSVDHNNIYSILKSTIDESLYDRPIINKITGLHYQLYKDSLRHEYFIRYSLADSIYVISGWKDKFLSFYQSIPGMHNYNLDELNRRISEIAAFKIEIPKDAFQNCSRDNPYFIEYVDKERMIRVRCYQVYKLRADDNEPLITDPSTLIEITRFLDKEMVS